MVSQLSLPERAGKSRIRYVAWKPYFYKITDFLPSVNKKPLYYHTRAIFQVIFFGARFLIAGSMNRTPTETVGAQFIEPASLQELPFSS